ncbi:hypothetical protein [Acidovorax lacteus]|uniref:Lipoprotein n=1 Tax=Acidovorax lacteus TaxID=1924988 RepID=A0ABP8L9E9_9BURK
MSLLSRLLVTAATLWALSAQAFAPQAGTWIVSAELDGKPGRGMAIDVQNDTFVMQMYAYESSGQPTFYLAVGTLSNNQVAAPLTRYEGGRFFGSAPRSGVLAGNPGTVRMRFTSGIAGFVTFPGEPERAMHRVNFAYPFAQSSLRGVWSFNSLGSMGLTAEAVQLTTSAGSTSGGNGILATSDGRFGCEHQTSGELAGGVLCVKLNGSGQVQRAYFFVYSVNEGEGYMQSVGVADDQLLSVRRLTTPSGVGTGIVIKEEPASPADLGQLQQRLAEAALRLQR